ncbi:MAG: hypothetical protein U0361_19145 [Nitrospiraceae bacterium]
MLGAAQQAHASTVGITKFIPEAAAGFLPVKGNRVPGRC